MKSKIIERKVIGIQNYFNVAKDPTLITIKYCQQRCICISSLVLFVILLSLLLFVILLLSMKLLLMYDTLLSSMLWLMLRLLFVLLFLLMFFGVVAKKCHTIFAEQRYTCNWQKKSTLLHPSLAKTQYSHTHTHPLLGRLPAGKWHAPNMRLSTSKHWIFFASF